MLFVVVCLFCLFALACLLALLNNCYRCCLVLNSLPTPERQSSVFFSMDMCSSFGSL